MLPVGACGDVRQPRMASVLVQQGGGDSRGGNGAQEGSGRDRGGVEEVSEATEVLLLSSTRGWLEWVCCTMILSPLSLYGSHQRRFLQVDLWVVHGGGERWMKAVEARERGGRAVQFGLEENYHFLSPLLSSPLADEGSCRWARGWLLEVEDDG